MQKKKKFGSPLSKIQVARLVTFTAVDRFFERFNGRRRNELRNAAGLILKLRKIVAVHDLKISFCRQILVPPPLLATAPSLRLLWRRYWIQFWIQATRVVGILRTCDQGLIEKIFQGVRRSIPGPQILLGPPKPYRGPCR